MDGDQVLLLDYDETRAQLGNIGLTTLYTLIDTGQIQRVKIGRRAFITYKSLTEFVDRLAVPEGLDGLDGGALSPDHQKA